MESPAARAAALQGRLVQACAPAAAAARPYLGLSPVRLLEALRTAGVARPASGRPCLLPGCALPPAPPPAGPRSPRGTWTGLAARRSLGRDKTAS